MATRIDFSPPRGIECDCFRVSSDICSDIRLPQPDEAASPRHPPQGETGIDFSPPRGIECDRFRVSSDIISDIRLLQPDGLVGSEAAMVAPSTGPFHTLVISETKVR